MVGGENSSQQDAFLLAHDMCLACSGNSSSSLERKGCEIELQTAGQESTAGGACRRCTGRKSCRSEV